MKNACFPTRQLVLAIILTSCLFARNSDAAFNAYAFLEADGSALVGNPTVETMGGEDVSESIECFSVVYEYYTDGNASRAGVTQYTPVTIRKRVDKSSPLLAQALVSGSTITGVIKFFEPNPSSGQTQNFYTLNLANARITAIRSWLPDTLDPASSNLPKLEEISIVYDRLILTSETGGTHATVGPQEVAR